MRITKIEINSYKSINEPVEINFYDAMPTILIGKNGSGKTNILEALNAIAEANGNFYGLSKELSLNYKVHISLSEEDVARLFPGKKLEADKCQFIACPGKNCKIDRIESAYLVPLLNAEISEIHDLANKLKRGLDIYTEQLNRISYAEIDELSLRVFQITNFRNSTTNFETLKLQIKDMIKQVETFADSLTQSFESEESVFRFNYVVSYFPRNELKKLSFRLHYVKPDLAPFEAKFITVNEAAIKREITRINNATKESCERITALIHEIDDRAERLKEALTSEQQMSGGSNTFYKFIRELQKCVGSKCLFLQNECSTVIFKNDDLPRAYYRDDKSSVILQTYVSKVYSGEDKENLLEQLRKGQHFSLSDAAFDAFEQYLNKNIPKFENGMYDRISVEKSGEKIPTILLHENAGETVALDSTSAGRRWYFTYYFMKNTLAPGELFIIDEPAAMLHPIAQKEVLHELLELEKQGIKVIYSTHSPYLIPSSWESAHFVAMREEGTVVTQEKKYDHLKQVIGGDIFDLQELLEKYQRCDKEFTARRCYQAILDHYQSIKNAAEDLNLSIPTIESWRKSASSKKFRCPKLENIILIASATSLDISELL